MRWFWKVLIIGFALIGICVLLVELFPTATGTIKYVALVALFVGFLLIIVGGAAARIAGMKSGYDTLKRIGKRRQQKQQQAANETQQGHQEEGNGKTT